MVLLRVLVFLAGVLLIVATVTSSLRTVILPRGVASRITRAVFTWTRLLFEFRVGRGASYEKRDRIFALYGPMALLALLFTWITLIVAGFTAMYWALGRPPDRAFVLSGSSIMTLGFDSPTDLPNTTLVIVEAGLGLFELALLITYLPSIYAAFQRREALVTMLEVRAGSPPSGLTMLQRFWRLDHMNHLSTEVWEAWERWFVDLEEAHTSTPPLHFLLSCVAVCRYRQHPC